MSFTMIAMTDENERDRMMDIQYIRNWWGKNDFPKPENQIT